MNGEFVRGECRWCGQRKEGNAGDFYHEKRCHREDVIRRIKEAKTAGMNERMMRMLRSELELASDMGD